MKRLIGSLLMLTSSLMATESHLWLLAMTNVPGVKEMDTPETEYGVQVFMDSDNPLCTGFTVTLEVEMPDGERRTIVDTVARQQKAIGVVFGTAWSTYLGTDLNWRVVSLSVEEF